MNLNPFVFSYKQYPNSKLATFVNKFCSGMQKFFLIIAIILALVIIFDDVENWEEALIAVIVFFLLWLLLILRKNVWSDKIAAKQENIDNQEIEE